MDLQTLTRGYFSAFENKNLEALKETYSDDVVLKDWDIECHGIDEMLSANGSLFNNVDNIHVAVIRCCVDNVLQTTTAEICITLDGEEILVADIITFNQDGKIKSIRAYKG
jgi:hypothetical protein